MQGICFHFSPQGGSGYIEIFSGACFVPAIFFKRGKNFHLGIDRGRDGLRAALPRFFWIL